MKASPALKARLQSDIRHGRRETVYKVAKKRYGNVPCFVCGEHVKPNDSTLEHIIPRRHKGTDAMDNLWISHTTCNRRRGSDINFECWGYKYVCIKNEVLDSLRIKGKEFK